MLSPLDMKNIEKNQEIHHLPVKFCCDCNALEQMAVYVCSKSDRRCITVRKLNTHIEYCKRAVTFYVPR